VCRSTNISKCCATFSCILVRLIPTSSIDIVASGIWYVQENNTFGGGVWKEGGIVFSLTIGAKHYIPCMSEYVYREAYNNSQLYTKQVGISELYEHTTWREYVYVTNHPSVFILLPLFF